LPACIVIAWYSGYRWSAPLVGLLAAWPLLLLWSKLRFEAARWSESDHPWGTSGDDDGDDE